MIGVVYVYLSMCIIYMGKFQAPENCSGTCEPMSARKLNMQTWGKLVVCASCGSWKCTSTYINSLVQSFCHWSPSWKRIRYDMERMETDLAKSLIARPHVAKVLSCRSLMSARSTATRTRQLESWDYGNHLESTLDTCLTVEVAHLSFISSFNESLAQIKHRGLTCFLDTYFFILDMFNIFI